MKRFYILTILSILAVISANAQVSKIFEKYSSTQGVTTVYISKAMLSLMPSVQTGQMDLNGVTDKLNSIRVLTTSKSIWVRPISDEIISEVKKDNYEILMLVNEDDQKTIIYMKSGADNVNDYLIYSRDKNELNLISINGTITPTDVQKMNKK